MQRVTKRDNIITTPASPSCHKTSNATKATLLSLQLDVLYMIGIRTGNVIDYCNLSCITRKCRRLAHSYEIYMENALKTFQLDWRKICRKRGLHEGFIRAFQTNVDWTAISCYQRLSEAFIREFQDRVDWYEISIHQILSETFMRAHKYRLDWFNLYIYNDLSKSLISEFKDRCFR